MSTRRTNSRRLVPALIAGLAVFATVAPGRRTSSAPAEHEARASVVALDVDGAAGADRSAPDARDGTSPVSLAPPASTPPIPSDDRQEWRVEPGTDLETLTDALQRASAGDRIVVAPGTYAEPTLVVDKPLEIVGLDRPVLDGEGERQIMTIVADSVTVRGFEFRNVGVSFVEDRSALMVDEASHCTIRDNHFEATFFGIYLANSGGCRILDNELRTTAARESQAGNGIHLWYSRDVTIRGNRIEGHRDGIYFEFVEDSEVSGNYSANNLRYGLHFMFSDRCRYQDNVFTANGAGVAVMYTEDIVMRSNVFERNWGTASFGLLMKDIRDSELRGNLFRKNSVGIVAEGSNRMTVSDNDFLENGWAIKLMANSQDNQFSRNNFVGNSFDVATNSRRSYSTFEGNYWDGYRGYDLDRDGVGDVPFRPVRLFSLMVEHNEPSLVLLRSFLVTLLDAAERVVPVLTPETLVDERPSMERFP